MNKNTVYIALGSNQGDKEGYLRRAINFIKVRYWLEGISLYYRTDPVGYEDQDWFINAAIKIKTEDSAEEILAYLLQIEDNLDRVRTIRNGPRTIDLDILLFNQECINTDTLTVPHPRMHQRLFALVPLNDIDPNLVHPVLGKTIAQLLKEQQAIDDSPISEYRQT